MSAEIPCPECNGVGHHPMNAVLGGTEIFECAWCHDSKVIDHAAWFDYQPHRQRPKTVLDILLRDGSILMNVWPNADSFFSLDGAHHRIKDYRVLKVRLHQKYLSDEYFDPVEELEKRLTPNPPSSPCIETSSPSPHSGSVR